MKITRLKINHLANPFGYELQNPTISYVVEESEGTCQIKARVWVAEDEAFENLLYDSGEREDLVSTAFELPVTLAPMTRYFWKVRVTDDLGCAAESPVQWFETAKTVTGNACSWTGSWITPGLEKEVQAVVYRDIEITKEVAKVRAYVTGLGLYEFYLNGRKQSEECLLPGFCDYDSWIQYQTYELELAQGKNTLELALGDGWYKGWYGLRQFSENYGDRLAALAEIHIWYADGTKEVIGTDTTWKCRKSRVCYSGIYPGEIYDMTLDVSEEFEIHTIDLGYERLSPRLSPPIVIHEHLKPVEVIHTPAGENVLDMGQNMVGWLSFRCRAPKGAKLNFQFGEILQDGNFYRDNLRTAKAEFTYISDGEEREVRQHFTFYGFRFVKITGWEGDLAPEDFTGLVIHSEMEELGELTTSDPLVNQLIHNAKWGMKGNFVDVPTDCPQRDERYGWTGDAQIFSGTASYFMDTYAFYVKYGKDLYKEQSKLGGSVPDVVPVANNPGDASTAWGDAATIIPWNVYLHSGDKGILRRQYASMKDWVDYMKRQDDTDGARRLWLSGTHYADWLALDGNVKGGVFGATDPGFIASAYYFYSANIVAKAARILGIHEDAEYYGKLTREIYDAFIREYYTPAGNLSVNTMTGYVVALYMGLTPEFAYERNCKGLLDKLKKNFYHLNTGFVGTPYLCRVLSDNGMNGYAYHLLLEKGYPGWLYEVLMGATTIWERWNSVEPDGKISGTEMNSLNHYSYGSIVEWMFRNMAGITPVEEAPGFKQFRIAPQPDFQIQSACGKLRSASGEIGSEWKIDGKQLKFRFVVPFDSRAEILLPDADAAVIEKLCIPYGKRIQNVHQIGAKVSMTALTGVYEFLYEPTTPYRKIYSLDTPWEELMANPKTKELLKKEYLHLGDDQEIGYIPFEKELCTLEEMTWGPFTCISQEERERLDQLLRAVE